VLAQEHAETKLSYSDRKELKMKTGKDSHGWDAEKAKVLAMITDRIQQICYTKTTILEKSQEAINKLRGEWKSVIDFHTRCLQYYISTSSNYISMLKVLIDIAYIYHKLQYFHSALELLDVIYEEISKINSEYVENNKNDKGITIDIDIARLKRLSIKVKDCDGRQFYYNVSGITFEKDIIMQTVMYRRALIYLDMEKYYEAVFNFTLAVVIDI
jgi:tetratricopeptide (TPR) repeat protein